MNYQKYISSSKNIIKKLFKIKNNIDKKYNNYKLIEINNKNIINNIIYLSNEYKQKTFSYKCFKLKYNIYIDIYVYVNTIENLDNEFKKIIYIFKFFEQLNECNKKLNIHIYMIDEKKVFEKKLDFDNINSGINTKNNEIIIIRKEEYTKVLIHELIHFYNKDFKKLYNYKNNKILIKSSIYQLNNVININEPYVECIALILHVLLISRNYNNFLKNIIIELTYTNSRVIRLLSYSNIKNIDINNSIITFYQDANVFSYYILKYLLFFKIKKILKIFINKKNHDIQFLQNKYVKIIENILSNQKFFITINNDLHNYDDYHFDKYFGFTQPFLEKVGNTLRMTYFDMKNINIII